jgi:hypothetical protein
VNQQLFLKGSFKRSHAGVALFLKAGMRLAALLLHVSVDSFNTALDCKEAAEFVSMCYGDEAAILPHTCCQGATRFELICAYVRPFAPLRSLGTYRAYV